MNLILPNVISNVAHTDRAAIRNNYQIRFGRHKFFVYPRRPINIVYDQPKVQRIYREIPRICNCTCQHKQNRSDININIPGVNRVVDSRSTLCVRSLWALLVVLSIVACFVQFGRRISSFIDDPLALAVDVVRFNGVIFPTVTVCPFYPFQYNADINDLRKKYAQQFNISYERDMDLTQKIDLFDLLKLDEVTVESLWQKSSLGLHPENIKGELLMVKSNIKNLNLTLSVNHTNTYLGICTSFTLDDELIYDGPYNGIQIVIKNLYKIIDYETVDKHWLFTILLDENNDLPKHSIYHEVGYVVHPWRETAVYTLIKKYERLNAAGRPCQDPKTVNDCKTSCLEDNFFKRINCTLPYVDNELLPECNTPEDAKATYNATLDVYDHLDELCPCNDKCSEYVYTINQDAVMLRENESIIKVLLQNNRMDFITEEVTFTADVLMSEIGGNLGLFLNVCIPTLIQIIEAIITKCRTWLS